MTSAPPFSRPGQANMDLFDGGRVGSPRGKGRRTMNESFAPDDEIDSLANGHTEVDYRVSRRAPVASGSVDLLTESDYKSLMVRSSLGTGLANITSRLLHQLASGGDPIPYARPGRARVAQIRRRHLRTSVT